MTVVVRCVCGFLLLLLVLGQGGCLPSSEGRMDEEKEPHFLSGRTCINNMDYRGAIEEFHKALETNPQSASAHFQLGWLYEEREPDAAAAIYHYEQFLKLRPESENAEVIRQHIVNCKQDLAKTILPLPVTPGMQHEFEQLAEENKRLREELEKWRAYATRLQAATNVTGDVDPVAGMRTSTLPSAAIPGAAAPSAAPASIGAGVPPSAAITSAAATSSGARTYVVRSGDTPYAIARKAGVKLDALMASNPGVDPRRLRVGQVLNLPAP